MLHGAGVPALVPTGLPHVKFHPTRIWTRLDSRSEPESAPFQPGTSQPSMDRGGECPRVDQSHPETVWFRLVRQKLAR